MIKTTFTLQATNEDEKLHLSVSFLVYHRMVEYLKIHKCAFSLITTEAYTGECTEKGELIVLSRNITLQFASSKSYYKMVENLINSIDKTNINKNG